MPGELTRIESWVEAGRVCRQPCLSAQRGLRLSRREGLLQKDTDMGCGRDGSCGEGGKEAESSF